MDHTTQGLISIIHQKVVLERAILPFNPIVCIQFDIQSFFAVGMYPSTKITKYIIYNCVSISICKTEYTRHDVNMHARKEIVVN
jgi:hypothetical protein